MLLIDIDGPSAVGKTTVIQLLRKEMTNSVTVNELLMQKTNPYSNWETPAEFLKKQLWFFDNTLQRYSHAKMISESDMIQINDIGIIDVIIHTRIYPIANSLPWNVYPQFKNAVKNLYQNINLANIIIYLYASEETLKIRKQYDTSRIRNAFESNMKLYSYQKEFYEMLMKNITEKVFCIDTELDSGDLMIKIKETISKHMNSTAFQLFDLLDLTDSFFRYYK
jgi:thymidylate kinase